MRKTSGRWSLVLSRVNHTKFLLPNQTKFFLHRENKHADRSPLFNNRNVAYWRIYHLGTWRIETKKVKWHGQFSVNAFPLWYMIISPVFFSYQHRLLYPCRAMREAQKDVMSQAHYCSMLPIKLKIPTLLRSPSLPKLIAQNLFKEIMDVVDIF